MNQNFSLDFKQLTLMNIEDIKSNKEAMYERSLSTRNYQK